MTSGSWSPREQAAWRPPDPLSVSQWAESHREIVSKDAAEPGRWSSARAPYLRGIMDALSDPLVEEVYVVKPARIGGSEVGRNFLGRSICLDPGAFLVVFPSEAKAVEQLRNEILPLLETDALRPYLTESKHDLKSAWIELRNMRIYPAWAGSPTSLAERTIRYVWLSEVDKYPPFSGREADPMSLAKRRTQTWGIRRKVYAESTPTTRLGAIWRAAESCPDKRRFWVPCPRCGELQILQWAQVRWPQYSGLSRREASERIKQDEAAYYECPACKGRIEDREKGPMEEVGVWRSEGQPGSIVAFYLSGLLSMLGLTWSRMAAQFLLAKEAQAEADLGPLMEFVTQSLGEPFEDQVEGVRTGDVERKAGRGIAPRVAPSWAAVVLASVDTQKDHFYWVTRAWGVHVGEGGKRTRRSRLLDYGRARSFDELRDMVLGASYPVDGWEGEHISPLLMGIDARGGTSAASDGVDRSRTDEVYRFTRTDPSRIVPLMGAGKEQRQPIPIRTTRVDYKPPGGAPGYPVTLHILDAQHFADCLARLIEQQPSNDGKVPEVWELCSSVDREYATHLTGEVKVAIRRGGDVVERWQKRSQGRRVDWLDCERYNLALADMVRADACPDEAALCEQRKARVEKRSQVARGGTSPATPDAGIRYSPPDGRSFLACNRKPQ